jgi:ABC-type multidrug transport system fused ATPase/permease subunit
VVDQLRDDGEVTEEDYAVLRYTVSARRALMEETLGDEDALTLGSVAEILRRAREAMNKEAEVRFQTEVRNRQVAEDKAGSEMERATVAEEALKAARQESAEERESADEKHQQDLARRIGNKSHRRAVRAARAIYIILALVVIVGASAAVGFVGGGVATVLIVIMTILTTRHYLFGESLSDLSSRVERYLERRFEEFERKSLEI